MSSPIDIDDIPEIPTIPSSNVISIDLRNQADLFTTVMRQRLNFYRERIDYYNRIKTDDIKSSTPIIKQTKIDEDLIPLEEQVYKII